MHLQAKGAQVETKSNTRFPKTDNYNRNEKGLALLMVIFIITLAGALVVTLADSTYVALRLNTAAEQRVKAEYILKSAINVARVLLRDDSSPQDDPNDDLWYKFQNGAQVPGELIGLKDKNLSVHLEIRPEGSKIPLRQLIGTSVGPSDTTWRDVLVRLFKQLGFDQDEKEVASDGRFKGKHFKSDELVANIIDYMDADSDSYSAPGFARGLESSLPDDEPFKNQPIDSLSELSAVPGFTPNRIRLILPYLTATGSSRVNINAAPPTVLKALHEQIDDDVVSKITSFRAGDEGPYEAGKLTEQLNTTIGAAADDVRKLISDSSTVFQILAKVEYGQTSFMARATVSRTGTGRLPNITSMELY